MASVLRHAKHSTLWKASDFVTLDGVLYVIALVENDDFGEPYHYHLVNAAGSTYWSPGERSDGRFLAALLPAAPGRQKGALLGALRKWQKRRKAAGLPH